MSRILFALLMLCLSVQGFSQEPVQIEGKITDTAGKAIAGASVFVNETKKGTLSDENGHFGIQASVGNTLTVNFVGYNTYQTLLKDAGPLTIRLSVNARSDLNDVVVVGYGTTKKVTLTGSVATISGSDIMTTRTENVVNSLTGKIPGVRIVQNTAEPGTYNNTFDIRGFSASGSGGAVSPPLIIVDGVPQDQSVFQRLDAHDIDNISVLKDASASIYGVQAANGVILVTTKKGKKGHVNLTYDGTAMLQVVNKLPKLANAVQWLTLINQMSMHNINSPILTFPLSLIQQYQDGTLKGTDWTAATMNKTAPEWQHSLSASGGSDAVNYYVSAGYLSQDGFFVNNAENYKKYNFRSNIDAKISKRLTLSMQISGESDVQHTPSTPDWQIFGNMWRNPPINPVYLDAGHQYFNNQLGDYGANSVAEVTPSASGYGLNKTQKFQGGVTLTYNVPFIEGLTAKGFFNYNYNVQDNKMDNKTFLTYDSIAGALKSYVNGGQNGQSYVSRYYGENSVAFLQFSFDYQHTFAKVHNVEALALYEQQQGNGDIFQAQRYETLNSDQLAAGSATGQIGQGTAVNPSASKSYVGKLHYDYKAKYLVDLYIRRDGSSLFPPSKPYGTFPGVTAAYRISEEPFFKNTRSLSFVDNLKIRGSYGILGDASGTSGYNFVGGYNYPASGNYQNVPAGYVFDGNFVNALGFRGLTNPNITWYTSRTFDLGIDADLWKGLLEVTADYYNRYRTGLLGTELLSLPGSVGATLPQENINSDETRGYELSLTVNRNIGKVHLSVGGNVSYARTKWVHFEKAPQGSDYADWVNNGDLNGRYNDVWFGYGYSGQFQSFGQIMNYPVDQGGGNRGLLPGDYIYQDWNHDGYFDAGDLHPVAGTNAVGGAGGTNTPTAPIVNFGLTISASYAGFDVTALLQGAAGKWIAYPIDYAYPLDHNGQTFAKFVDAWHPLDPTADPYNPNTVYVPGYYAFTGTQINQSSTGPGGINNASYLRLKSLEIGYTFSTKMTTRMGIHSLRVFANGYDLITITGLKGVDPEHPSDLYGEQYPLSHIFSAGLNLQF